MFPDTKASDPFLEALAQGGFQVEELARLHYPGGELIEYTTEYDKPWGLTQEYLKKDDVVIYEAGFLFENLFIRTDILQKNGDEVDLIEVKSKSFNSKEGFNVVNSKGKLDGGWMPYLFDLAFQKYVVTKCYPDLKVKAKLMLADKAKKASINGLNQLFRVSNKAKDEDGLRTGIIKKVHSLTAIGNSVLTAIDVDDIINDIINGKHLCMNDSMTFLQAIEYLDDVYQKDRYPNWPVEYTACRSCEFRASEEQKADGKLSGFEECFKKQLKWTKADFDKPKTWDVWDFRRGKKLWEEEGKYFMEDLDANSIGLTEEARKMSRTERQLTQVEKTLTGDLEPEVEVRELGLEMNSWQFPLNMIDFETSMMALPFHKGRGPYEQTAFQFSHHLVHEDGSVEHHSEFLDTAPGHFPNFDFVRALKKVLDRNNGTIFRYAAHENTVLNQIAAQLLESSEPDRTELISFITDITTQKDSKGNKKAGYRNMVDLCQIVKDYYYNPLFGGSNSLKVVLPSIIRFSEGIQSKYSKPISAIGVSSKNFPNDWVWLRDINGKVEDPYKLLPPVFEGLEQEKVDQLISEIEYLADGGAALTAYSKLQFQEMSTEEHDAIRQSLLKYCELDTLAMVMLYEHLTELI